MSGQNSDVDSVLHEMDTYVRTIHMVEVFCSCLKETHRAECWRGHTMHPRDDPAKDVRPDFALAGQDLRIIGEAKSNVTKKLQGQRDLVEQIHKYCCVLCWPDGQNPVHDVTILTSRQHAGRLSDLLERHLGQSVSDHKLSIMGFTQERGKHESFQLNLVWGGFTHPSLTEMAKDGLRVEARNAIIELNKRWFSDAAPPVLYTMSLIWERILPPIIKMNPDGADEMEGSYSVTTKVIESAFKEFSDSAPRMDWIKYAMESLVKIGRARKENDGSYTVHYRQIRRVRETFAKRWVKRHNREKPRPAGQS